MEPLLIEILGLCHALHLMAEHDDLRGPASAAVDAIACALERLAESAEGLRRDALKSA